MDTRNVVASVVIAIVFLAAGIGAGWYLAPVKEVEVGPEKPFAGTTLTWGTVTAEFTDAIKAQIPQFEEETGITVVVDEYPWGPGFSTVLTKVAEQTGAYDVILMITTYLAETVEADLIVPLDDYVANLSDDYMYEDIIPKLIEGLTYEGKLWGIPFHDGPMMLFYNTEMFAEKNLTPPEGWTWTWDEYKSLSMQLTDVDEDVYGTVLPGAYGFPVFNAVFITNGGEYFPDMPTSWRPAFNGSEGLQTLEFMESLMPYSPPGSSTYMVFEMGEAFVRGEVAINFNWPYVGGVAQDPEASEIVGKVGYAAMPLAYNNYDSFCIPTDSPNPEAAWEFIKWMTRPRAEIDVALNGGIPSRISSHLYPPLVEEYPWYPAMLEATHDCVVFNYVPFFGEFNDIMTKGISEALTDVKTPQEALDDMAAKVIEAAVDAGLPV